MNKINWINGQAGGTPLSAENLNQMQDNIENAIEDITIKTISGEEVTTNEYVGAKRLYKKRIDCGYLPSSEGTKSVPLGLNLSQINIERIDCVGKKENSEGDTFPIPAYRGNDDRSGIQLYLNGTQNVAIFNVGTDRSNMRVTLTLYYTKNNE